MASKENNEKILKKKYVPSAEFYSLIVDNLQDYSIFTLDTEFYINSWSSGSTKIFGYEADEVIGESFGIIFTDEDLKSGIPKRETETAVREGRATDNRWHVKKDKSLFYAYGLVFPLTGVDGEMLGYVKILRDLTDRKQSEDAIKKYIRDLEDLNIHKESVLAILSHDLRSPLSAIIGTAKYMKDNYHKMKPDAVQEMLNLLHKSATDELDMLDYLVEWARIKYASDVFSPVKVLLAEYVEKVFETLSESASAKKVKLHHDIDKETSVFADRKMLVSIIQNLVSNAIKHTMENGEISISTVITEEKVTVVVKDTGVGMSKEAIEKLFTPQMKTLSETRKIDKGAGIGLLLVKGFLEKIGGEIWVESTEGKGTSFYFTLPIEKPLFKVGSSDEIMFDESA